MLIRGVSRAIPAIPCRNFRTPTQEKISKLRATRCYQPLSHHLSTRLAGAGGPHRCLIQNGRGQQSSPAPDIVTCLGAQVWTRKQELTPYHTQAMPPSPKPVPLTANCWSLLSCPSRWPACAVRARQSTSLRCLWVRLGSRFESEQAAE